MLSRMQWIRRGIIALLALLVAGLGLAIWSLNEVVGDAVEDQGSAALGVDTTIDFISIGLLPPLLRVSGIEIENPQGFKDDNFLELGTGSLDVDLGSLFSPTLHARSLRLDDIDVRLERGVRSSNYGVLLNNVKVRAARGDHHPSPGRTVRIDEIVLHRVRVNLLVNLPGHSQAFSVTMPEVRMQGVGVDNAGPVVAGALFERVSLGVLQALLSEGVLPEEMAGDLARDLVGMPRFAVHVTGDVLRTGGDLAEGSGGSGVSVLENAAKDVTQSTLRGAKKLIPGD